jgi:hypothetical protein
VLIRKGNYFDHSRYATSVKLRWDFSARSDCVTYSDQWSAISARIRGLINAAHLHARFLSHGSEDSFRRVQVLGEQSQSVFESVRRFRNDFTGSLSPAASLCTDNFLEQSRTFDAAKTASGASREHIVQKALILLAAFQSEMGFILSDIQDSIRARSERAFSHLQRLIVVDRDVRQKWQSALKNGERACEKLGAVHLLWHGLFAFKVDALGGRSDLVFQDELRDPLSVQRYSDGLVLTEWKVVHAEGDAGLKFEEARIQAGRYSAGVLAGCELATYRYAVVVSSRAIMPPADAQLGSAICRHINIAVAPEVPSRVRANRKQDTGRRHGH